MSARASKLSSKLSSQTEFLGNNGGTTLSLSLPREEDGVNEGFGGVGGEL